MQNAANAYNIPLPQLQQMVAQVVPNSAAGQVYSDPNLGAAQTQSIGELGNIADQGGLTLTDKANFDTAQRQAAQGAMAQRQAIQNLLNRTGGGNSGVSAALQLGAQRGQQESSALAGQQEAASAQQRALQAVLQRGQLAGQVRAQGVNEATNRARAIDQMNQYNAQARQGAQQYNLGLPQQQYQNQLARAQGYAGTQQNYANYNQGEANRIGGVAADTGTGVGLAAGALVPHAAGSGGTSNQVDNSGGYTVAPQKLPEEETL
jgi:hypothetical protein